MKNLILIIVVCCIEAFGLSAQIDPLNSPYYGDGPHVVESDSNLVELSIPLLFYYPETAGSYPVFMFQLGANGFGSSEINRHTYDLFMEHLASYGFVVIVIDDSQAGLPSGASFIETHDWYLAKIADPTHWLSDYADPSKFVVGGHSNGGVNASALLVDRPTEVNGIVFMDSYPDPGFPPFFPGHDVSGYTGKELTMSANENDPVANKTGYDSFTSVDCKTFVDIAGLDHGGFGDYDLASQPVGPIGRDSATATIRHFLVSWMLSEFSGDAVAANELANVTFHPNTIEEFINNCGSVSSSSIAEDGLVQVELFPNPTNGIVQISADLNEMNVLVYNTLGQQVHQENSDSGIMTIDIGHLPKGFYIVQIASGDFQLGATALIIKD